MQWKLLARQVETALRNAPSLPVSDTRSRNYYQQGGGQEVDEGSEDPHEESRLSKLPFLPRILIQGHEWKLVLFTHNNDKTLLWSSLPFSSTQNILGVFKILTGLAILRRWAIKEYLP